MQRHKLIFQVKRELAFWTDFFLQESAKALSNIDSVIAFYELKYQGIKEHASDSIEEAATEPNFIIHLYPRNLGLRNVGLPMT